MSIANVAVRDSKRYAAVAFAIPPNGSGLPARKVRAGSTAAGILHRAHHMPMADTRTSPLIVAAAPLGRWERLCQLYRLMRARERQGHLSVWRQACEMAVLKLTRDIGVHYYQMAGMWRRGTRWSDKLGHLGARAYIRALASANPLPYRKLSQHKLPEKALLTLLGFPTPRFLGFACARGGRTAAGAPLSTAAEFEQFVARLDVDRLCFKLMEGHGGSGFIAVHVLRTLNGTVLAPIGAGSPETPADFFTHHIESAAKGRLIEEYIDQHPAYAQFNETSVNTLRLLVYARPRGRAATIGGYLRIGRHGAVVDNHGAGGLVAGVDLASGVLADAFDGTAERHVLLAHPDSGQQIAGVRLPYWNEARALAEAALDAFPKTRFAGFDIAVTPNGPVIIEINNYPGLDGVASTDIRLAEALRE